MKKAELRLSNTTLENVFKFLYSHLEYGQGQSITREIIKNDYPDGITRTVTYQYDLTRPIWQGNKISLQEHYYIVVQPGKKDTTVAEVITTSTLDGLIFTGFQLQTNTVLLEIVYLEQWQELVISLISELQELFGGVISNPSGHVENLQVLRKIADSAAGTVTITGKLNPGYDVLIAPTGGALTPPTEWNVLEAYQSGQIEKPQEPQKPPAGSNKDVWFDYYHDMKRRGYKITFAMLEKESAYSENTFKEAHKRYKVERGID